MSDLIDRLLKKWPVDNMKRFGHVNPDGPEAAEAITAKDAEIARRGEALQRISWLSCNAGGWFEQDPFGEYAKLGDIASQALATDQIETSGYVDCEASHDA